MKKRLITLCFFLLSLLAVTFAHAERQFEEELHYFTVFPEQPGGEGDQIKVVAFFWYACPHCYQLEPHLSKWLEKKPDNIDYVAIPAMFSRPDVVVHAKTYYALQLMGIEKDLRDKIFEVIHVARRSLKTQESMEEFLAEHLIDLDAYRKAMKSFAVQTQAKRAALLASHYNVRGVPAIVVDGKYRAASVEAATMMEVTDYLIDRVRKERQEKKEEGK